MREADFQRWVVDVAVRFGWKVWHVPAPMRASSRGGFVGAKEAAGLPDLILLHDDPPRLIFAEVKGTDGALSESQIDFLRRAKLVAEDAFTFNGLGEKPHSIGVHVLRPGMEEAIENMLRSKVVA